MVRRDDPWSYPPEMVSTWMDAWLRWVSAMMGPMAAWARPWTPSGDGWPPLGDPDPEVDQGLAIELAIEADPSRPTQARLELDAGARQVTLGPIVGAGELSLPTGAVQFGLGDGGLRISISIGTWASPGVYLGQIEDAWTGESKGQLAICVGGSKIMHES